ncbi:MAG: polysaccharide deacetylase family protein [Pseudonocardia sp.]
MDSSETAALSRRHVLQTALSLAGATGVVACAATQQPPPPASAAPGTPSSAVPSPQRPESASELDHGSSGRPEVALTFHGAGDLDLARQILSGCHDRGAAVTVLAVGTWLARYPDAAHLVTDLGHELGNHTWSHPDLSALDEAGVRAEIERCRDRIASLTGTPGTFFRPSQAQHATPTVLRAAAAAGYPTVLSYDVDSRDFTDPGARAIRRYVATAGPGSVVSLHLGHPGTVEALPGMLDDLASRGLTPVTARQLFG